MSRETQNIMRWLKQDLALYGLAYQYNELGYMALVETLKQLGLNETPDGVSYTSSRLNVSELDQFLRSL